MKVEEKGEEDLERALSFVQVQDDGRKVLSGAPQVINSLKARWEPAHHIAAPNHDLTAQHIA